MSNELKCTGGDWKCNHLAKSQIINVFSETSGGICQIPIEGDTLEEHKANAHLIAASKDLYNSLVDMVEGFWWDSENEVRDKFRQENPGHPIIKAEAAIIKANSEYKSL